MIRYTCHVGHLMRFRNLVASAHAHSVVCIKVLYLGESMSA